MRQLAMICLLAVIASAQTPTKPQSSPAPAATAARTTPAPTAAAAPATLPDSQPVISINGVCPDASPTPSPVTSKKTAAQKTTPTASAGGCTTTITKIQLEKLIAALNRKNEPVTPEIRRTFAQNYAELLAWAEAARKAGIDDARFAEYMRFIRLRELRVAYTLYLQQQYKNPSQEQVEEYYKHNTAKYEEIKLGRIFIPAKNPAAEDKDVWEKKAAQTADELHNRAGKGEDLDKLQKEAYTALGLTIAPPPSSIGTRRRGTLSQGQEQELFALKAGEVSKVQQEAAGYTIYKVESRETLPLDKVKEEISATLARANMEAKIKEVMAGVHADLNETYFGPPATAAAPPSMVPPGAANRSNAPAAQPNASPAPQAQHVASPAAPKP